MNAGWEPELPARTRSLPRHELPLVSLGALFHRLPQAGICVFRGFRLDFVVNTLSVTPTALLQLDTNNPAWLTKVCHIQYPYPPSLQLHSASTRGAPRQEDNNHTTPKANSPSTRANPRRRGRCARQRASRARRPPLQVDANHRRRRHQPDRSREPQRSRSSSGYQEDVS